MTVGQLIKILISLPQDEQVIIDLPKDERNKGQIVICSDTNGKITSVTKE